MPCVSSFNSRLVWQLETFNQSSIKPFLKSWHFRYVRLVRSTTESLICFKYFPKVDYLLSIERSASSLSSCFKKLDTFSKKLKKGEDNTFRKVFEPNTFHINKEVVLNELIYLIWGGVRYDSQESITRLISSAKNMKEKQLQNL